MTATPISLYFGVDEGKRPSLETIALASLEWAALIRDIAAVVAPDVEFEIEFVQSEDGSVWLSNLLRAIKAGDRKALGSIVLGVLMFFAMGPALHLQSDFGTWLLKQAGHKDDVDVSDESLKKMKALLDQAIEETRVEERRRAMIAHAERDPDVTSIGVDFEPRKGGPVTIITREYFPSYDALPVYYPIEKVIDEKDTIYERNVDVSIIRATLKEGERKPRWRFRQGDQEWSADIVDNEFVWALNRERTGLPLAAGQHMRVDVAIDLRQVGDTWEPKNRRILRVRQPHIQRDQGELGLGGQ